MKIYQYVYLIKDNINIIQLFNKDFVDKNKSKFRIVLKNKIYPLQSELIIKDINIKQIKIKIISLYDTLGIEDRSPNYLIMDKFCESKKYKKNNNKYNIYLKCSLHEMSKITYKINRNKNNIKIFGKNFVEKNKNKCIIIYNDIIFPLKEFFLIKDIQSTTEKKLEITLIELVDISDRSYMFRECNLLEEFPLSKQKKNELFNNMADDVDNNLSNSTTNKEFYSYSRESIIKMDKSIENSDESTLTTNILNEYSSTIFLVDKFIWFACNCTNISNMFEGCSSLISLPDLSKWNTINITNISYLIKGCTLLTALPDISNWNIKNVSNMFLYLIYPNGIHQK